MQKKDIAILAVRLLALYIMLLTVYALPDYVGMMNLNFYDDALARAVLTTHIIGAVIKFCIGIALWIFSIPLANLITKDLPKASPSKKEFTLAPIQMIAVSVVGLIILSSAIPALVEVIISYIFPAANLNYVRSLDIAGNMKVEIPVIDLVTIAIKLVLGFWFLLGAKVLLQLLGRFGQKGKPYKKL